MFSARDWDRVLLESYVSCLICPVRHWEPLLPFSLKKMLPFVISAREAISLPAYAIVRSCFRNRPERRCTSTCPEGGFASTGSVNENRPAKNREDSSLSRFCQTVLDLQVSRLSPSQPFFESHRRGMSALGN